MIKIQRLCQDAKIPTRSGESAGYDLYAPQDFELPPGATTRLPLGIATEFAPGMAALVWDRSSMGAKGVHVFGGVIDSDYRGEWSVVLHNTNWATHQIKAGDRIAQFLLQSVCQCEPVEVSSLSETQRGAGGFGSTGK